MITVQLSKGDQNGVISFAGDEVTEPCEMTVTGDYSLQDIQALFWHITNTADGAAQGIYPLTDNVCAPYELLSVMKIYSIEVSGVPQDWQDELAAIEQDTEERFEQGEQS